MTQPLQLAALTGAAAVGFGAPFEMLHACHERMQRTLALLAKLRTHHAAHGPDEQARQAAHDVARYFDLAAPHHHEDEERHLFPVLLADGNSGTAELVARLQGEHRRMEAAWRRARPVLAGIADGSLVRLTRADNAALSDFADLYAGHIAAEEQVAYPAAQQLLDTGALAVMGREMQHRRGVR